MQISDILEILKAAAKVTALEEPLSDDKVVDETSDKVVDETVDEVVDGQLDISIDDDATHLLVNPSVWLSVANELKNNDSLDFDYLMCITSYDLGSGRLGLAYNFYSNKIKHSIEIRIEFEQSVEVPSVATIWRTADWHEREAYDMMGALFSNHPDMRRILLSSDWEGYPLRKDYKEPDYYRGVPVPKDKTAWE